MRGLLNWKISATVLITFGLLLFILGQQPSVGSFFIKLGEKVPFKWGEESRNVSFHLSYRTDILQSGIDFSTHLNKANITLTYLTPFSGGFSGTIGDTSFKSASLEIRNFTGTVISLHDIVLVGGCDSPPDRQQCDPVININKTIEIKGSFDSAQADGVTFHSKNIYGKDSYSSIFIEGFEAEKLEIWGSGTISVGNTETKFVRQKIIFEKPLGTLMLGNLTADSMIVNTIEGLAKKIFIGDTVAG